jgi:SAM-dependent methyltransferase
MQRTCGTFLNCQEERKLLFTKKGYPIKECLQCGHRFTEIKDVETHLEKTYSDDYFFEGKEGYPNYLEEKDILYKSGIRYAKLMAKYMPKGDVLDVGCAAGFILKGFQDSGWHCYGVEPNDTMAAYGRKELNLDIRTGGMETFESNQQFDLINLIQVIGSLYDLDVAMQKVSHLAKQGGLVLVESWDRKSWIARLLRKNWHEYCPPSVVHWYSDETLQNLLKQYDFALIAKGYPSKRINVKHGLAVAAENMPNFVFKKRLVNFFSRLVGNMEMIYPPVDLKWYIFKKL